MSRLCYAQVSYKKDFADTLENCKKADGHVDYMVVVHDGSFTEEQMKAFEALGVHLKYKSWDDNFPAYRNASLEAAREIGADWIAISDADEHYSDELWQDLKEIIIHDLEPNGFDMIGIRCKDAFDAVDWWDDLDQLKELPGGTARESSWYKNLVFKLYPDVNYSGSGMGNVHEIWGSQSHPWKQKDLGSNKDTASDKEKKEFASYYYVHRKSSLRIWHNAGRNLFMGGGGDTVGDLNPMWVELRKVTKEKLDIDDWHSFEAFVTGEDDKRRWSNKEEFVQDLVPWIIKALTFSATDYGTETRETAKWIVWYHRRLLDIPEIQEGIKNPPKPDAKTETEIFVRKMYFQVLGRHPDRGGLDNYVKLITEGKLKKEQIRHILEDSSEYRQKFGEKIMFTVTVNTPINITESDFYNSLGRSKLYAEVLKPRLDLGKSILDGLTEVQRQEFWKWFYEAPNKDAKEIVTRLMQYIAGFPIVKNRKRSK